MANDVEICNLALDLVGGEIIQSLNESREVAQKCKRRYEIYKKAVLVDHDWGFAKRTATLSEANEEHVGWSYAYAEPVNCLHPRGIWNPVESRVYTDSMDGTLISSRAIPFDTQINQAGNGKLILTNQPQAKLVYTVDIQSSSVFPPMFVDAFTYYMAAGLAIAIRGDKELHKNYFQIYSSRIASAKRIDSSEFYKLDDGDNDYVRARM